jgi:hypothetical protein
MLAVADAPRLRARLLTADRIPSLGIEDFYCLEDLVTEN